MNLQGIFPAVWAFFTRKSGGLHADILLGGTGTVVLIGLLASPLAAGAATNDTIWTLPVAIQRAVETAPEMRAAEAEVAAREAELKRDTAWPNPAVEVRADQKLGMERGSGGIDATQLALTQPLPLRRLSRQRTQAEANLAAARAGLRYRRMLLENQTARAFHQLQLAEAKQRLARERFETAQQYSVHGRKGDRLVRYLSVLDRTRLSLLAESARQAVTSADGEWREAQVRVRALLVLAPSDNLRTAPLAVVAPPPPLAQIERQLDTNPGLVASQREVDAARAGIDVARASRFADPTITVFRERDFLAGARRAYSGIMLGIQVPLWNANRGPVDRAVAEAGRAKSEARARRRDLEAALRESWSRLTRLIGQADHYSSSVLEPSRKFLVLTRRAFASGELGVLALLDANNNYFDAAERHIELLGEAALAAADLRLAAGQSLLPEEQQ